MSDPTPSATDATAPQAPAPPMRQRALKGLAWTAAERWLVRLGGLVTFVVLGRLLQPDEFGLIALAAAFVGLLQVVTDLGFGTWLIQAKVVTARETSTAFWSSLGLGIVSAIALVLAAGPIAGALNEPELAPVLRWLSISLVMAGLNGTPTSLLFRELRFRELAIRQICAVLAGSVVGITLAALGAGVYALVAQLLVAQVVTCVVLFLAARWTPTRHWSRELASEMVRFGTRVVGLQLMQQMRDQGEVFLISVALSSASLGYWAIATRVLGVLLEVGIGTVNAVAMPTFTKLRDDNARMNNALRTSLSASALVVGPALVGLSVLSPMLIPLVFGDKWEASADVAAVLAIGGLGGALSFFDRSVYLAYGKLGVEVRLVAIVVATHLSLVPIFGPHGLLPLAIALAVRSWLMLPVRFITLHRTCGVPYGTLTQALRIIGASFAAGGITLLVREQFELHDGWGDLLALGTVFAVLVIAAVLAVAHRFIFGFTRDLRRKR